MGGKHTLFVWGHDLAIFTEGMCDVDDRVTYVNSLPPRQLKAIFKQEL